VLADTGQHGSTAEAVGRVRARRDADPVLIGGTIDRLAELTDAAVDDIRSGDRDTIGARMLEAHDLLRGLGVSSSTPNSTVAAATEAGDIGTHPTRRSLGGTQLH